MSVRMSAVAGLAALLFCTVFISGVSSSPSSRQVLQDLHLMMTPDELRHFLGHSQAEYEIVYIRSTQPRLHTNSTVDKRSDHTAERVNFQAFGKPYSLKLKRNQHLLNGATRVVRKVSETQTEEMVTGGLGDCHFLHTAPDLLAAVSRCDNKVRGFVADGDAYLDIAPLNSRLHNLLPPHHKRAGGQPGTFPHLVRRTPAIDMQNFWDHEFDISDDFIFPHQLHNFVDINFNMEDGDSSMEMRVPLPKKTSGLVRGKRADRKTIELALYVDKPARELFLPFFDNDIKAFTDFVLGFINQIQALYHQPSLGIRVDLTINYLEIMEVQQMRHHGGERGGLLSSFCKYNSLMNRKTSEDKWDMGLYLSALNFYAMDKTGKKSPITMGLAVISGVCQDEYSCVIGELGTTNDEGKPYPSAGFTSAYIMAHEIGHNLGMHHDSQTNSCPANGYIMSPSRGTKGETVWSSCSRNYLLSMDASCLDNVPKKRPVQDHRIFRELPGQVFDAFDQCQLFLRDRDAELYSAEDLGSVCERVKCKSPHRIGYYYAGPALEGTFCGNKRWCEAGSCRPWSSPAPPVIQGGWGDWDVSKCSSGCLEKAQGVSLSRRRCDNPKPLNTEERCAGPATNVQFCDDSTLCHYRLSAKEYASQKCREFSQMVQDIRPDGVGVQVPHTDSRPWSACSIYCRLNSGTWYTPRQDLNDLGINTYFPDGTWCHNDGIQDYYCQFNECQPKGFEGISNDADGEYETTGREEIQVLQNALSKDPELPASLTEMHTLDDKFKPVEVGAKPVFRPRESEENFEEQDVMTIEDIKKLMAKQ